MQSTITLGNSPAIRASRALRAIDVRRMCVRAIALVRRFSLALASIFTIITYTGILFCTEVFHYLTATIALGFICLADSTQKGGAE